jgi:hypothetical protein
LRQTAFVMGCLLLARHLFISPPGLLVGCARCLAGQSRKGSRSHGDDPLGADAHVIDVDGVLVAGAIVGCVAVPARGSRWRRCWASWGW